MNNYPLNPEETTEENLLSMPKLTISISPVCVKLGKCVTITAELSGGDNPKGKLTFLIFRKCQVVSTEQKVCDCEAEITFPTCNLEPGKYYVVVNYSGNSKNSQTCACGYFCIMQTCKCCQ